MGNDRKPRIDAGKSAVPGAADSWRRNIEILDLVNRIRDARTRRTRERDDQARVAPTARPVRE